MAQFQQIVLDYLEHYQPEEYARLKEKRTLREYLGARVDELYATRERELARLRAEHPQADEEYLRVQAEQLAIEEVLTMPKGEEHKPTI